MADVRFRSPNRDWVDANGDDDGRLIQGAYVGEWKAADIAASGTATSFIDLGGNFDSLQIVIPTITSAQIYLTVSEFSDGTYQTLCPGTSGYTDTTTGAYNDTWELYGWRYIKINVSAAQSGGARKFKVRGLTL